MAWRKGQTFRGRKWTPLRVHQHHRPTILFDITLTKNNEVEGPHLGQNIFFFFFPSHLLSPPFYSLSLLVVTQIRGHIAGSSPLLPITVRAFHFFREKISALSSLVHSRRIVLTHARRSQQLILYTYANKFKISPRRDSNSRTNTSSIRGLPLVHRGDRHSV